MAASLLAVETTTGERVTTKYDDIEFFVDYSKSYPDGMRVNITHTVKNASGHAIDQNVADGVYDRKFSLIGPDGQPVIPYPYFFRIFSFGSRMIEPGESAAEKFDLANWFPFRVAGEYRCTITRRIYVNISTSAKHWDGGIVGDPVDLTAPEFRFRVESSKHDERSTDTHGLPIRPVLDGINEIPQPKTDSGNPVSKHSTGVGDRVPATGANVSSSTRISGNQHAFSPWLWILTLPTILLVWLGLRSRKVPK